MSLATDVSPVSPDMMASGVERCRINFGLEHGREKRSAW